MDQLLSSLSLLLSLIYFNDYTGPCPSVDTLMLKRYLKFYLSSIYLLLNFLSNRDITSRVHCDCPCTLGFQIRASRSILPRQQDTACVLHTPPATSHSSTETLMVRTSF
ncbi:hypothetical protein BDW59DRAFT_142227 [Aspergillus cavernicola]|uniref:Secreted protein n=1 Tax=Aspergillus cavernicola TaxID=176166 RepID=A0ABR4IQI9_9EURO